jgi:carboxyl-terminal processing protease
MPRMKRFPRIVVGLLLSVFVTGIMVPGAAADFPSCPGCGMVWKDTCLPFEQNNESAYNDEMTAALSPVAANLTPVPDYSNLSWSTAFRSLNNLMKERYAFTEWRDIDWDTLYAEYSPQIAVAEKTGDKAAYYRALRGYLYSVHDGHILIGAPDDNGARYADVGGGFGIAISRLDSGKVIVSYVANGSAAEKAGLAFGDEATRWNGKPVGDAINETSILWAVRKPSTAEGILLQQQRFLTRAPVGTVTNITLINGNASGSRTIRLIAYDDQYDTLTRTTTFLQKQVNDVGVAHGSRDILAQITNDTVTTRILPGGYTYIAVYGET